MRKYEFLLPDKSDVTGNACFRPFWCRNWAKRYGVVPLPPIRGSKRLLPAPALHANRAKESPLERAIRKIALIPPAIGTNGGAWNRHRVFLVWPIVDALISDPVTRLATMNLARIYLEPRVAAPAADVVPLLRVCLAERHTKNGNAYSDASEHCRPLMSRLVRGR